MENNQKRILLNMAYYTLVALGILFSVLFMLRIAASTLPVLIKIIYYIWSVVLIITLLFDIYCTMKHEKKYITGIIFFVLTILCVIMAAVVFFVQGISFGLITTTEVAYFINIALSFMPIQTAIYAFLFGERIINFHD